MPTRRAFAFAPPSSAGPRRREPPTGSARGTGTGCTCRPAPIRLAGPPRERRTAPDNPLQHNTRTREPDDEVAARLMEPTGGTRRKCVAAAYLPANCGTAAVDVPEILRSHAEPAAVDPSRTASSSGKRILLSVNEAGLLVCVEGTHCPVAGCNCWILSVPLADDCHAYNCRLSLMAAGTVGLHTTAAVLPGQQLKMWFPPDLQLMLHVPFLTPVNIRDERKYVCHECGYTCEKPNPLKIHLALDCGKLPRTELWSRLRADGKTDRTIEASFRFSLTPAESRTPLRSSATESAFRPYSPAESTSASSGGRPSPARQPPPQPPQPPPPSTSAADASLRLGGDSTIFDRRCAEMETIVSNLGHSEQGHLCIYCGKVYSRKYGLKIHIRTHTGFKPLKCKYCYRPFGDPSNLNKHVRLHAEGETPYKCECCGKILVRKRDLDRHMKSRHAQAMTKSVFKLHVPV
ncbi:Zinc finger C2H2-type [Cinara cedri]|uniref:Zinc finger C2H2-type n=1 Tax=Cinara cedri TaxID=506608 RepID=A0A5E4MQD9_9HEMI|nr:Zinc finger C2H2-type [Cinara cedri]